MKPSCLYILTGLLIPAITHPAFEEVDFSARAGAKGGAYVGLSDDGSGLFYNPAGLSQLRSGEITFYTTQLFGFKELTYLIFVYGQPFPYGSFGLGFSQFGNNRYKEQIGVLGYSNQWSKILIGGSLKGMNLSISEYSSSQAFGLDVGILWKIQENLSLGMAGKNINGPELGKGEELPQSILFGLSFRPARELLFNIDLVQDFDLDPQVRVGQEYLLSDHFAFRAGWLTSPQTFTGGFGYAFQGFHLNYGIRSHPALGLTHGIALSYLLRRE